MQAAHEPGSAHKFHVAGRWLLCAALVASLAACWGDDDDAVTAPVPPSGPLTVGGTVSGLAGTGLVLQNNAGDDLAVSANGTFTFATAGASGGAYAVTVKTAPSVPAQKCTVANGTGTIASAAITNVAVTCAALVPRFAYSTATAGGQLSIFTVDPATGTLTAAGNTPTPSATQFMELSVDGRFAYWNERNTDRVAAASIDPATGALTAIAGSPFPSGGDAPRTLAMAAGGKFLVTIQQDGDTVTVHSVDAATGALALVGAPVATGDQPAYVVVTPDGKFVYVMNFTSGNISAYALNATTGALTPVAGSPFAAGSVISLVLEPRGKFLYAPVQNTNLILGYAIDAATGVLTPLAGSPFAAEPGNQYAAVDPAGRHLYVSALGSNTMQAFTIDATSGALTPVAGSPYATDPGPSYVAMDPGGRFVLVGSVVGGIRTHAIDPVTGALTLGTAVGGLPGVVGSIRILPQ